MRKTTLLLFVLFASLVLFLTGCIQVRAELGSEDPQPIGVNLRLVNKTDQRIIAPPELKTLAIDREPLMRLWPDSDWTDNNKLEFDFIGEERTTTGIHTLYISPFVLNGKQPKAAANKVWVGAFTTGTMEALEIGGKEVKPSFVCEPNEPGGPALYLYEIDADHVHDVELMQTQLSV